MRLVLRRWFSTFFFFATVLVASSAGAQESELVAIELTMHRGEEIQIPAEDLVSYSQSLPVVVVRSTPDGRALIVEAHREGDTALLLVLTGGRQRRLIVHVVPTAPSPGRKSCRRADSAGAWTRWR